VNKNVAERSFNPSPPDEKDARSNLRKENIGARDAKDKRRQIEIQGGFPGASLPGGREVNLRARPWAKNFAQRGKHENASSSLVQGCGKWRLEVTSKYIHRRMCVL
jgi:hypothetical protein